MEDIRRGSGLIAKQLWDRIRQISPRQKNFRNNLDANPGLWNMVEFDGNLHMCGTDVQFLIQELFRGICAASSIASVDIVHCRDSGLNFNLFSNVLEISQYCPVGMFIVQLASVRPNQLAIQLIIAISDWKVVRCTEQVPNGFDMPENVAKSRSHDEA